MSTTSRRITRFTAAAVAAGITLSTVGSLFTAAEVGAIPVSTLPPILTLPTIPPVSIPPVSIPPLTLYTQDLAVSLTNNLAGPHLPGTNLIYTAKVSNYWNSAANGVGVLVPVPTGLTDVIWTCSASTGSTCGGTSTGNGAINRSITVGGDGVTTFTISAKVSTAAATIIDTATIVPPAPFGDNTAANNTASDIDAVTLPTPSTTAPSTTAPAPTLPPTPLPTVPPAPVPTAPPAPAPTAPPVTAPPGTVPQTVIVIVRTETATKKPAKKKVVKKIRKSSKRAKKSTKR